MKEKMKEKDYQIINLGDLIKQLEGEVKLIR